MVPSLPLISCSTVKECVYVSLCMYDIFHTPGELVVYL
jgi:hypothetical protein